MGELEAKVQQCDISADVKVQQCDISADVLEQWTFWHQPEVGYRRHLNKKKLRAAFCLVMACENPVPHAK